jgi:hypothetical protein
MWHCHACRRRRWGGTAPCGSHVYGWCSRTSCRTDVPCAACSAPHAPQGPPPHARSPAVSGDVAERALERGVMRHIRVAGQALTQALQAAHAPLQSLRGEHSPCALPDVLYDVRHIKNAPRPLGGERGTAGQHDQRMDVLGWHELQDLLRGLDGLATATVPKPTVRIAHSGVEKFSRKAPDTVGHSISRHTDAVTVPDSPSS